MVDASPALLLSLLGAIILLVAWLPMVLRRVPLSLPIICLGLGFALSFTSVLQFDPVGLGRSRTAEHLNESVVLIALMGAGLRLDRKFDWRRWGAAWRLVFVAMPVTILIVFLAARHALGFSAPAALLLGAALAPTDPVLAADVQTGPPGAGDDGETRFGLTSEAGLNDGLAFPFVLLAVALQQGSVDWGEWLVVDLLGELAIGAAIGVILGRIIGYFMFRVPALSLSDTGDGLVAIGATLLCYAGTLAVGGNGFVAVFCAALAIRSSCPDSEFHRAMASFSGQIERMLVMIVLLLFGWALGNGLLDPLTWRGAALGLALIFVFRPFAAWLGFLRSPLPRPSKILMAFFGIRGIGTLFYLQFAFNRADYPGRAEIWSVAAFAILCSILLHGITSSPLMARADALRKGYQK